MSFKGLKPYRVCSVIILELNEKQTKINFKKWKIPQYLGIIEHHLIFFVYENLLLSCFHHQNL